MKTKVHNNTIQYVRSQPVCPQTRPLSWVSAWIQSHVYNSLVNRYSVRSRNKVMDLCSWETYLKIYNTLDNNSELKHNTCNLSQLERRYQSMHRRCSPAFLTLQIIVTQYNRSWTVEAMGYNTDLGKERK